MTPEHVEILSAVGRLQNPPAPAASTAAAEPFEQLLDRAAKKVDELIDKFVATAFFYPILQQASSGPFQTEMFDGGFTEQAFRSRLNVVLADEISSSSLENMGKLLGKNLLIWLRNQPYETVRKIAYSQEIDAIG